MDHFTTHGGVLECNPRCYRYSNKDWTFLVRLSRSYSFQWVERKLLQIYKIMLPLFNVPLFCSVLEVNTHWRPKKRTEDRRKWDFICMSLRRQTKPLVISQSTIRWTLNGMTKTFKNVFERVIVKLLEYFRHCKPWVFTWAWSIWDILRWKKILDHFYSSAIVKGQRTWVRTPKSCL